MMGIDVILYAVGDVTDETLAAANAYLEEHLGEHDKYADAWLIRSKWEPERVEFSTFNRYYGPGYERGPWPFIYSHIRALERALPACAIFYGGDTDDDGSPVSDPMLEEMWEHWLGPHGQDYRKPRDVTVRGCAS